MYLPKRMWSSHKKWPLILYLHGRSLRGNDLTKVSSYGLPHRLLSDRGFPFIVVSPQLPDGQRWTDVDSLASLVTDVMTKYPVDRSRVYAMGFSMGASGTWRVAAAYPKLFAAVISVAGEYELSLANSGRLKPIPIWAIHGDADTESSPILAKQVFDAFTAKGGKGRFTLLPGKDHNIPDIFNQSDLYRWLLSWRRRA